MGFTGWIVLCLLAIEPAPPPDGAVGFYSSDMIEIASNLQLASGGLYEWHFDAGALSLVSQGRWIRADDGTVLLTSDGERVPPVIDLVRTSRDDRDGVAVALEPDSLDAARILEIEAEYADGSVERMALERIRRRVTSPAGRPLVALRLGSEIYDFWSPRIPVAEGTANVLSFRIAWNDLNRVEFRSVPARIDGDRLSFDWRGMTLTHRRVETVERSAGDEVVDMDAVFPALAAAELPLPLGPVPPSALTGNEPSVGRMVFAPGETLAATRARSTVPFGAYDGSGHAEGVAELRLRLGDVERDFGRVASLTWYVISDGGEQRIRSLAFSHQDRLLDLGEALSRARNLAEALAGSGFTPGAPSIGHWADFRLIDPYRYDERVSGWDEAATLLADPDASVTGIELFSLRRDRWYVVARLMNVARNGELVENPQPGREWTLDLEVTEDQEPITDEAAADAE